MFAFPIAFFDLSGLTPHGFCLLWDPALIWTHAISDIGISVAYLTIPLALARFVRRRADMVFRPVFLLFAAFILLCGISHVLGVLTIWIPVYGVEAIVKAMTAVVSLTTAIALWVLLPRTLTLPSPAQFRITNDLLRQSEMRARASYTGTPLPLHVLDAGGIITDVSDRWLNLLGYRQEEVVGHRITEFQESNPNENKRDDWSRLAAAGEVLDLERRFVRKDGEVLDVLASARMERGLDGSARILCGLVDVTERTRFENALRESEQRARLALPMVKGGGVWDWDIVNCRVYCDEPCARILGVDPRLAAAGAPPDDYLANVPADARAATLKAYEQAIQKGGEVSVSLPVAQPDGSVRWFLARSHCTLAPDGTPLRMPGVLIDITDQRILEEQLRQSQKMEAVGQLTGGLAHDFNNMLQGIIGSLSLLKTHLERGHFTSLERYLAAAQTDAGRAATLTQRLLAFSRRQLLDPMPTDADKLIAGMTDLIRRTVGPGIKVEAIPTPDPWMTLCDPNQMESALLNLCINARDAMPEGGKLTIKTTNIAMMGQIAHERGLKPGEYVAVSVTDNGVGMAPEVAARAFDPFFTTKPLGAGTGLGLSMIYGFAQQSGGQARIYSVAGQGTTVKIYLPRFRGAPKRAETRTENGEAPGADVGETVLVVDDEPMVRMLVKEVLLERGYTAIEAEDGMAGLEVLQSAVRVDLLISDVGLPGGMNGRQMADAARVVRPDLKVLITGYAADAAVGEGHLDYGMQVITKPFALDTLARKVREMISVS